MVIITERFSIWVAGFEIEDYKSTISLIEFQKVHSEPGLKFEILIFLAILDRQGMVSKITEKSNQHSSGRLFQYLIALIHFQSSKFLFQSALGDYKDKLRSRQNGNSSVLCEDISFFVTGEPLLN